MNIIILPRSSELKVSGFLIYGPSLLSHLTVELVLKDLGHQTKDLLVGINLSRVVLELREIFVNHFN